MPEAKKLEYKLQDGSRVPLFEADTDNAFKVRRKDKRGAVIGNPTECIEAKALCRLPNVVEAYIGSGKDAYVIFSRTATRNFKHALHYTIPSSSAKTRDAFDGRKKVDSQILWLKAPSKGRTLQHRRNLDKERRKAVKAGSPVTKRGPKKNTRINRLGIDHRPRAKIEAGIVSMGENTEAPLI